MSEDIPRFALFTGSDRVPFQVLAEVASAIQRQVSEDLVKSWGQSAVVSAFPDRNKVPVGYWPVTVLDQTKTGMSGTHYYKDNLQPYAEVLSTNDMSWSVALSHEILEMIIDPRGLKLKPGMSPDVPGLARQRVQYLVEICDPVNAHGYHRYPKDGIDVADFVFPNYYDTNAVAGNKYCMSGVITKPWELPINGYLMYQDQSTRDWYIAQNRHGQISVQWQGKLPPVYGSIREWVDEIMRSKEDYPPKFPELVQHSATLKGIVDAAASANGSVLHATTKGRRRPRPKP